MLRRTTALREVYQAIDGGALSPPSRSGVDVDVNVTSSEDFAAAGSSWLATRQKQKHKHKHKSGKKPIHRRHEELLAAEGEVQLRRAVSDAAAVEAQRAHDLAQNAMQGEETPEGSPRRMERAVSDPTGSKKKKKRPGLSIKLGAKEGGAGEIGTQASYVEEPRQPDPATSNDYERKPSLTEGAFFISRTGSFVGGGIRLSASSNVQLGNDDPMSDTGSVSSTGSGGNREETTTGIRRPPSGRFTRTSPLTTASTSVAAGTTSGSRESPTPDTNTGTRARTRTSRSRSAVRSIKVVKKSQSRRKMFHLQYDIKGLGEIEVLEGQKLGRGASGSVKLVRHIESGEILAMKIVPFDLEAESRRQIVRELKNIVTSTAHPNVIHCYGAFHDEGSVFMVFEHMDLGSLTDVLAATGPIPEEPLKIIAYQALAGLAYLHDYEYIVHRDIKPSNLLMNSKGEVRIADFGVSRSLAEREKPALARVSSWVGTTYYMCPERMANKPYPFATDVWSLGLSLLELALGRLPLLPESGNVTFFDLYDSIVNCDPPALPDDGRFSAPMRDFMRLALAYNANDRPSASALLKHAWLHGIEAQVEEILRDDPFKLSVTRPSVSPAPNALCAWLNAVQSRLNTKSVPRPDSVRSLSQLNPEAIRAIHPRPPSRRSSMAARRTSMESIGDEEVEVIDDVNDDVLSPRAAAQQAVATVALSSSIGAAAAAVRGGAEEEDSPLSRSPEDRARPAATAASPILELLEAAREAVRQSPQAPASRRVLEDDLRSHDDTLSTTSSDYDAPARFAPLSDDEASTRAAAAGASASQLRYGRRSDDAFSSDDDSSSERTEEVLVQGVRVLRVDARPRRGSDDSASSGGSSHSSGLRTVRPTASRHASPLGAPAHRAPLPISPITVGGPESALSPSASPSAFTATSTARRPSPFSAARGSSGSLAGAAASTGSLAASTDSLAASTDSLVGSTDALVGSTDSLVGSTDALAGSTDALVGSAGARERGAAARGGGAEDADAAEDDAHRRALEEQRRRREEELQQRHAYVMAKMQKHQQRRLEREREERLRQERLSADPHAERAGARSPPAESARLTQRRTATNARKPTRVDVHAVPSYDEMDSINRIISPLREKRKKRHTKDRAHE